MTTATSVAALLKHNMKRVDIAAELGLTPSAITQSIAKMAQVDEPVTESHKRLDDQYDSIEGKLLNQLEKSIPLLMRPMEISRVLQTVNAAKRRGGPLKSAQVAPTVLQLNLPVAIQTRFVLNSLNQVVSAGAQDLVTIPSAAVSRLASESAQLTRLQNDSTKAASPPSSNVFSDFGLD